MNYGKTIMGVIRSTFVIDADGKIEKALYAVKATGHRLDRNLPARVRSPGAANSGIRRTRSAGVAKWQTRQV